MQSSAPRLHPASLKKLWGAPSQSSEGVMLLLFLVCPLTVTSRGKSNTPWTPDGGAGNVGVVRTVRDNRLVIATSNWTSDRLLLTVDRRKLPVASWIPSVPTSENDIPEAGCCVTASTVPRSTFTRSLMAIARASSGMLVAVGT